MKSILLIFRVFTLLASLCFAISSQAQNVDRKKNFNLEDGIAIEGYDPVSYFNSGKAEEGSSSFAHTYLGVTYYFKSEKNKQLFIQAPQKYEPQFGGWCAFAMGKDGSKVEVDPETFKIINGKLYLFYNAYFNNTLEDWNKNEGYYKPRAETNWNKIISKKQWKIES